MQKKPITNKLLWIFAVGQFGWSLLSGIVANWMVYYYSSARALSRRTDSISVSGKPEKNNRPRNGMLSRP